MSLPTTISDYLEQLKRELASADPALLQDALYDAEEYLRSELAAHPREGEEALIARIASTYGRPSEVADIYRDTETTVIRALRPPPPKPRESALGRFFGVVADPRAYAALIYMLLSLLTGLFYFTWAVTGVSLSLGLSLTIIGVAFFILFMATVRVLSLVEGRIVEVMLGERMPRRPAYPAPANGILERIGQLFTDPRTWGTLIYQVLMLPLGIVYFTLAVALLSLGVTLAAAPLVAMFGVGTVMFGPVSGEELGVLSIPVFAAMSALGFLLLFALLHVARGVAHVHGAIAKHLLVKWGE
ncbi:MAG: sensor domain-containing protein [Silanimonas sp.]